MRLSLFCKVAACLVVVSSSVLLGATGRALRQMKKAEATARRRAARDRCGVRVTSFAKVLRRRSSTTYRWLGICGMVLGSVAFFERDFSVTLGAAPEEVVIRCGGGLRRRCARRYLLPKATALAFAFLVVAALTLGYVSRLRAITQRRGRQAFYAVACRDASSKHAGRTVRRFVGVYFAVGVLEVIVAAGLVVLLLNTRVVARSWTYLLVRLRPAYDFLLQDDDDDDDDDALEEGKNLMILDAEEAAAATKKKQDDDDAAADRKRKKILRRSRRLLL